MLVFLRSPIGRWVAVTLLLPLIATLLARVGRALQQHSGHPTRTSSALLALSRFTNRRLDRDAHPALVDPGPSPVLKEQPPPRPHQPHPLTTNPCKLFRCQDAPTPRPVTHPWETHSMKTTILAAATAATAATAILFSVSVTPQASAAGDNQVVGIEQLARDSNGAEISYTVTNILPSADPLGYPVAGQLYEALVMARATQGTAVPMALAFSAHTDDGATYPALANASGLSGAPLADGATTDGKIYFDVVGDVPTSIIYGNGPEVLIWKQPVAGGGSGGSGGGSAGGGGGSQGVVGSTGPNDVSPQTSGGDIGGNQGGTEGGGGNLSSGGGSGAPSGDTGGDSGSGGIGAGGNGGNGV